MFRPSQLWHFLTEPPAQLEEPELRYRTGVLLSVVAVVWIFWILLAVSLPIRVAYAGTVASQRYLLTTYPFVLLAVAAVAVAATLSARSGHYTTAARILVVVPAIVAFAGTLQPGTIHQNGMAIAALMMCGILLSTLDTAILYACIIAGYVILSAVIPGVALSDMAGKMLATTVVGCVSLAATIVRGRNHRQIIAQAAKLTRFRDRILDARNMEPAARYSSAVAQEINKIVASISSDAQIAQREGGETAIEPARRIRQATDRAERLIAGLFSFGEQRPVHLTTVDIDAVMKEREPRLSSSMREGVELFLRLSPETKVLRIDVERFYNAIYTLIRKAEKSIPGHGTITIETTVTDLPLGNDLEMPAGDYCTVIIDSTGPETGDGSQVFEPFFTTGEFGTGDMDLAAAYGTVRQSGGQIEAKSNGQHGSMFVVTVPRQTSTN